MTYHYDTFTKRYLVFESGKIVAQFEKAALYILKAAFPGIKET